MQLPLWAFLEVVRHLLSERLRLLRLGALLGKGLRPRLPRLARQHNSRLRFYQRRTRTAK